MGESIGENMTRDETKELLMTIQAIYPNFNVKPDQMTATLNAWSVMLEEYPAEAVIAALKIYVKTNNNGFAPSVSQLIGCLHKPKEQDRMTEGEAWYLVKKALSDSAYNAKERFEELPPEVQRAVGGVEMLRTWGQMDSDEVNSVVASNFQRTFKAVLAQNDYVDRVPSSVSDLVKSLIDRTNTNFRIGASDEN